MTVVIITYAFIKDPKVTSLRFERLKEQFGDSIANAYDEMDGTDAQEFVTLQEHLFNGCRWITSRWDV